MDTMYLPTVVKSGREVDGVGENFITFNPVVRARLSKTLQFQRDYERSGIGAVFRIRLDSAKIATRSRRSFLHSEGAKKKREKREH